MCGSDQEVLRSGEGLSFETTVGTVQFGWNDKMEEVETSFKNRFKCFLIRVWRPRRKSEENDSLWNRHLYLEKFSIHSKANKSIQIEYTTRRQNVFCDIRWK